MFDEQPDGDPHGECAAEIRRLTAECEKQRIALQEIADDADPDNGKNYRADDREGCLDAVFFTARAALATPTQGA